jgi:MFS family permease
VPDHVPVQQRAVVGAWTGVSQPAAVLLGSALVAGLSSTAAGYLVVAVLLVLFALPFLLSTRDRVLSSAQLPAWRWRLLVTGFLVSTRRHPDFAIAWLTRFLVQLGNATATLFLLYFLRDGIRYQQLFPGHTAEQGLVVLIAIYTTGIVLSAFAGGWLSDRIGRRKPLIVVAGVLIAAGAGLLAAVPTWPVALVSASLLGLGYGAYVSVDQALITQVLPNPADRGKDLGVFNVANTLPHVLGPALAGILVTRLGGYPALFAVTAGISLLGALLILRIRTVR